MGCKSDQRDANMQQKNSQENDNTTDNVTSPTTANTANSHAESVIPGIAIPASNSTGHLPSTPHGHGGLPHSSTDPNFRRGRPRSAQQHRQIGQILRIMGDGYTYSCGIALRQMGDQLSGEYEVRRALSTGDLPNSVKNS